MVRSVSRSRGCRNCTRRKVKCDESVPQCSQCRRIGKHCPGSFTGLLISQFRPQVDQTGAPYSGVIARDAQESLLSRHQPSRGPVFEQLFLAHFVSAFAKPSVAITKHESWMEYLPDYLAQSPLLKPSIRAATMAYYADISHDEIIREESDRWHILALHRQRALLNQHVAMQTAGSHVVPAEEEVCACMMLLYFELIRPTSIASWVKHMNGACDLLQLRGPANCTSGPSRLLFQALKLLTVHCSFRLRIQSPFASRKWLHFPLSQTEKSTTDKILDILLSLYAYLPIEDESCSLSTISSTPGSASSATNDEFFSLLEMRNQLREIEQQREQEASKYSSKCSPSHQKPPSNDSRCDIGTDAGDGGGDFCTISPWTMASSATIIILYLLFLRPQPRCTFSPIPFSLKTEPTSAIFEEQFQRSALILHDAERVVAKTEKGSSQGGLNPGSCLQLVFPVEIVAGFAFDSQQRDKARDLLDRIGWTRL